MTNRLDDTDRDLLTLRPDIDYIEPDVQPSVPEPVTEDLPQLEDFLEKRRKVMKLAKAADILAAFMQARADEKAQNMVINLDPKVDAVVVQAMLRRFPGADPYKITYPQYRECKDAMREAGQKIARKANITPDQVNAIRDDAINMLGGSTIRDSGATTSASQGTGAGLSIGDFDTEKARTGGLRPELDNNMYIVEPLDLAEIQFSLICILVNFIWKNFILAAFSFKIPVANVSPVDFLPKKLCNPGDVEAPDLILLGGVIPPIFTQKSPSLSETAPEVEE